MRPRPLRAWSFLAFVMVVAALGLGGARGVPDRVLSKTTDVSHRVASVGSFDAVLRTEVERVEGAVPTNSTPTTRPIVVSVAALLGVALLLELGRSRHTPCAGGPPALTRLRSWVGLRAPPSSLLV